MSRCLALFVVVLVAGRVAAADPRVDQAAAAFDDLRYRDAVRLLDEAWRAGGHGPAELRRIFALAGTAAGSTGDAAAAQAWFSRWLALEPDGRLAAGSSPKLAGALAAARRELAGRALAAHATRHGPRVAVAIDDDPLALVVAVRAGGATQPITAQLELELAASGPIALIDRYGNALVELAAPAPSVVPVAPAVARPAASVRAAAGPAWYARWPLWAVVAAGGAAVGGVALHTASAADGELADLVQHSESHEYSEARAQEQRLSRAQWTARIALGAAAVSAAFAVVCYVRGRAVRTTVTASGDGAAVAWSVRY